MRNVLLQEKGMRRPIRAHPRSDTAAPAAARAKCAAATRAAIDDAAEAPRQNRLHWIQQGERASGGLRRVRCLDRAALITIAGHADGAAPTCSE